VNLPPKEVCTYTLGIQTEWQLRMMVAHGHQSTILFDATFGTNIARVHSFNQFRATSKLQPALNYVH
jgi:hypothetical protein